jgi:hypothetical protein
VIDMDILTVHNLDVDKYVNTIRRNPTSRSQIVGFFLQKLSAEYTPGMGQRNS